MKKNILIYGAGKSGLAVEEFYKTKGINPILYDDNKKTVKLENIALDNIEIAVVSPGVDEESAFYQRLKQKEIQIVPELELGFRNVKGGIIAITGTNGKTTTASLLNHILNFEEKNVFLAGNIGIPLISLHNKTNKRSKIVCEVSSFQLINISKFRPKVSAILNLSPDHITRHKTFEKYIEAKYNIFKNQKKRDFCVLNYDDELTKNIKNKTRTKVLYFSKTNQLKNSEFNGIFKSRGKIFYKLGKKTTFIMHTKDIKLIGQSNLQNVLAAVQLALLCHVRVDTIRKAVACFTPLPNRLETVKIKDKTLYINSSKATNIASAISDLSEFKEDIVLILGGSDKGEDFKNLFRNLRKNVYKAVIYGEVKQNMRKCADAVGYKNYIVNDTFKEAFFEGYKICEELSKMDRKNVLLLSPACASYDEFENYEQRGENFRELVNGL